MKRKTIKIRFDNNVYLTFLLLFIAGVVLLSFRISNEKNNESNCLDIPFDIIGDEFSTKNTIKFNSNNDHASRWEWDFGDGSEKKFTAKVTHRYEKPGKYNVVLKRDRKCVVSQELDIAVTDIEIEPSPMGKPDINMSPKTPRIHQRVRFKARFKNAPSSFAKKWEWILLEGGKRKVISTKAEFSYTFKRSGAKTIYLIVNDDENRMQKKAIRVLPPKLIAPVE